MLKVIVESLGERIFEPQLEEKSKSSTFSTHSGRRLKPLIALRLLVFPIVFVFFVVDSAMESLGNE